MKKLCGEGGLSVITDEEITGIRCTSLFLLKPAQIRMKHKTILYFMII